MLQGGGDFLLEILPYINFEEIKKNPKWICGFSDTTGISFCTTTICDIATIYSENFAEFGMNPWHKCLENTLQILEGKQILQKNFEKYQDGYKEKQTGLEGYELDKKVEWKNANGEKEINIEGRTLRRLPRHFSINCWDKIR